MNGIVRIALLGYGRWGRNHAAALHRMGALALVVDPRPEALEEAARLIPGVDLSSNCEDALRPDIRGVVLAVPVEHHAPLAKLFLSHGKHVLVEKPLASSADEGAELVRLAADKGVILATGHVLEHHPARRRLETLVQNGELGRLLSARLVRTNLGTVRDFEDVLWSFAPHDIAFALWLGQGSVSRVTAQGFDLLQHGVADTASLTLEFDGPAPFVAHIDVSWLEPLKEQRCVLVGTAGMIEWCDTAGQKRMVLLRTQTTKADGSAPVVKVTERLEIPVDGDEPLTAELADFLEAISSCARPRVDGQAGLDVLMVLEAARMSMNKRRTIDMSELKTKTFIHPTAVIDDGAIIGESSKIWHFCHVMPGARIGTDVVLGQNCFVASKAVIGDGCRLQNNISVYDLVILEDEVFVGPSAVFTNVRNPRAFVSRKDEYKETRIKRGATLGANSTVVCGSSVGEYAFIAAGSVVSKDIPAYALAIGVPARVVGHVCRCGDRLLFTESGLATCARCGLRYQRKPGHEIEFLG